MISPPSHDNKVAKKKKKRLEEEDELRLLFKKNPNFEELEPVQRLEMIQNWINN